MLKDVMNCFNAQANTYDGVADVQRVAARGLSEKTGAGAFTRGAERILEIGCGTGLFSEILVQQFPHASFLLTDIAPNMVERCRTRFLHCPRVDVQCHDVRHLDVPHDFDLMASSMTLHWLPDIAQTIRALLPRLRQTGRFVFSLLGANSLCEWRAICEQFQLPVGTPLFPTASQLKNHFPEWHITVETHEQRYDHLWAFLQSLKKLGATATRPGYAPLSPRQLRSLVRHFHRPMNICYEIIYGSSR